MAWKSGIFNFNNLDLATVMNQVSRWYNVDVRYEGGKPQSLHRGRDEQEHRPRHCAEKP